MREFYRRYEYGFVALWLILAAIAVFGLIPAQAYSAGRNDAQSSSPAFVSHSAEEVYWQVDDNAPVILVLPIFPQMTRLDGQGFVNVGRLNTDAKPIFWRQLACSEAEEAPYDTNASDIVCSIPPGIEGGDWNTLAITMVDLQELFNHGGYAVGVTK